MKMNSPQRVIKTAREDIGWIHFSRPGNRFATHWALCITLLFSTFAGGARAQTTSAWSDAEIRGQQLAGKILDQLAQQPAGNSTTNTGVLRIRNDQGIRSELPIECVTVFTPTNWQTIYQASWTNRSEILWVVHTANQQNLYFCDTNYPVPILGDIPLLADLFHRRSPLSGADILTPFAGSDFWLNDLGLEFFHWPGQKVIKQETHRSCSCTVLESTSPDPTANGYSRVVSWIDNETLGIVEAYAYDSKGQKLKDFYPKDFKKVNGHWQVQTLVMENTQTGSRSRLEFDLNR
jgi:hypothetical protein